MPGSVYREPRMVPLEGQRDLPSEATARSDDQGHATGKPPKRGVHGSDTGTEASRAADGDRLAKVPGRMK
jgi:hypothetical protein